MKNSFHVTLSIAATLLLIWILKWQDLMPGMKYSRANLGKPITLEYVFTQGGQFSLDPEQSDFTVNQTVLDGLVGTLVKYGPSGKLEPYLTASWSTDNDRLTWRFKFKSDLRAEDGTSINAITFAKSLCRQFKTYLKRTAVLEFEKLSGWDEFAAGNSDCPNGIVASAENELTMKFNSPPSELLELLRMPYFGFYSDANFDTSSGFWKSPLKIISSAAFRIGAEATERKIILERRDSWFSSTGNSVDTVTFEIMKIGDAIKNRTRKIIMLGTTVLDEPGFRLVRGTPTISTSLVLSPDTNTFFLSKKNRVAFQTQLRKSQMQIAFTSKSSLLSNFLFAFDESPQDLPDLSFLKHDKISLSLQISPSLTADEQNYIQTNVRAALLSANIELQLKPREPGPDFLKKELANKAFDIRIARVDVGARIGSAVLKMMFCSGLGVNFPDPNKSVCKLVERYSNEGPSEKEEFARDFNQILADEAFVIPLFHSSIFWLYSDDIDPTSISPIPNYPRLESIRLL